MLLSESLSCHHPVATVVKVTVPYSPCRVIMFSMTENGFLDPALVILARNSFFKDIYGLFWGKILYLKICHSLNRLGRLYSCYTFYEFGRLESLHSFVLGRCLSLCCLRELEHPF